jgi:uncharacterized nucleotidyltransferase DUF6036
MREVAEQGRIRRFMAALGDAAHDEARVYFTGGASAVLQGWRATTVDVDIEIVPDRDELLRALPALKERLAINVELAAPSHFIPELPGWEDRSVFIAREGRVQFFHYDFYSQALAKIERGHSQDRADVASMIDTGLVVPSVLRELFEKIVPALFRYPALDPAAFRRALESTFAGRG